MSLEMISAPKRRFERGSAYTLLCTTRCLTSILEMRCAAVLAIYKRVENNHDSQMQIIAVSDLRLFGRSVIRRR